MNRFILSIVLFFTIINFSYADKLEQVQKRGYLIVGIEGDLEPLNFLSRNGKRIGFEIDMIEFIVKELKVKVKYKIIPRSDFVSAIKKNKIDVAIATILHKKSMDKEIDFSISYLFDGQSILANKDSVATSYTDYTSKKIGALVSSNSGKVFEVIQPLAEIVYFKSNKEMIKALKANNIDAVTGDYTILSNFAKKGNGKLKLIGRKFTIKPYAIALKENESNLLDAINFSIQESVKSKEYDKMHKKWFKKGPSKEPELWL